jgi:hypothetical protein
MKALRGVVVAIILIALLGLGGSKVSAQAGPEDCGADQMFAYHSIGDELQPDTYDCQPLDQALLDSFAGTCSEDFLAVPVHSDLGWSADPICYPLYNNEDDTGSGDDEAGGDTSTFDDLNTMEYAGSLNIGVESVDCTSGPLEASSWVATLSQNQSVDVLNDGDDGDYWQAIETGSQRCWIPAASLVAPPEDASDDGATEEADQTVDDSSEAGDRSADQQSAGFADDGSQIADGSASTVKPTHSTLPLPVILGSYETVQVLPGTGVSPLVATEEGSDLNLQIIIGAMAIFLLLAGAARLRWNDPLVSVDDDSDD